MNNLEPVKRVNDLIEQISSTVEKSRSEGRGTLSSLKTNDKRNIIFAVNEIYDLVIASGIKLEIDDTVEVLTKVWSSSKIRAELNVLLGLIPLPGDFWGDPVDANIIADADSTRNIGEELNLSLIHI